MNIAIMMGRVTRDAEIRRTKNGTAICVFTLAVDTGWGEHRRANYFSMKIAGKRAESSQRFLLKGVKIVVNATPVHDRYTKQDGTEVNAVSFFVNDWEFAESKSANQVQQNAPVPTPQQSQPQPQPYQQNAAPQTQQTQQQEHYEQPWMQIPSGADGDLPFV